MKISISFLYVMLSLYTTTLPAQIKEEKRSMSQGVQTALVLNLPNTNEKLAEKVWKEHIGQYGGSTKKNRDELFTDNARIDGIGEGNTVDVYAKINGADAGATISVWFDLGGAYVGSAEFSQKYTEAEKLMLRYSLDVARAVIMLDLEAETKELRQLEVYQKKLERDNEQYHQDIESAKLRIQKAEASIDTNVKEQSANRQKIEAQQKEVQQVQGKLDDL